VSIRREDDADTTKARARVGVRCDLATESLEIVVSGMGGDAPGTLTAIEVNGATQRLVASDVAGSAVVASVRLPQESAVTTALADPSAAMTLRLADGRSVPVDGSRQAAAVAIACGHGRRAEQSQDADMRQVIIQPLTSGSHVAASVCERRPEGTIACRAKGDRSILTVVRARGLERRDPGAAARLYENVIAASPWTTYVAPVTRGDGGQVQQFGTEPDRGAVIEAESRLGVMLLLGMGVAVDRDRGTALLVRATQQRCEGSDTRRDWLCPTGFGERPGRAP
jgi:hypothetical protein